MPKSPLVDVVHAEAPDVENVGNHLLVKVPSRRGRTVYYTFIPYAVIVERCREAGIVFIAPKRPRVCISSDPGAEGA